MIHSSYKILCVCPTYLSLCHLFFSLSVPFKFSSCSDICASSSISAWISSRQTSRDLIGAPRTCLSPTFCGIAFALSCFLQQTCWCYCSGYQLLCAGRCHSQEITQMMSEMHNSLHLCRLPLWFPNRASQQAQLSCNAQYATWISYFLERTRESMHVLTSSSDCTWATKRIRRIAIHMLGWLLIQILWKYPCLTRQSCMSGNPSGLAI